MKFWLDQLAKDWLIRRGYWVIAASAPTLVLSHGVAVRDKNTDGSCDYRVFMPIGHKLWVLNGGIVTEERS